MAEVDSPRENVRALQRALQVAEKRNGRRKFPALYDRIAQPDVLQRAWQQVWRNKGAAGEQCSELALEADIRESIGTWNQQAKPFVWVTTANEILSGTSRFSRRIAETGH